MYFCVKHSLFLGLIQIIVEQNHILEKTLVIMASGAVTVAACVALLATLCHGVPDLVFKNNNGANDDAKYGDSLFTSIPTKFANNNMSAGLNIEGGILNKFRYFPDRRNRAESFIDVRVRDDFQLIPFLSSRITPVFTSTLITLK